MNTSYHARRAALHPHAHAAGIIDYDALELADISGVTLHADGTDTGGREAVAALKSAKPHLFKGAAGKHAKDMTPGEYADAKTSILNQR